MKAGSGVSPRYLGERAGGDGRVGAAPRPSPGGASCPGGRVPDRALPRLRGPGGAASVCSVRQALPVPERRAVILHHVAGLSVEEVAAEVGSPVGTVNPGCRGAWNRLQAELEGKDASGTMDEREPGQSGLSLDCRTILSGKRRQIAGETMDRGNLAGGRELSGAAETGAGGGTGSRRPDVRQRSGGGGGSS